MAIINSTSDGSVIGNIDKEDRVEEVWCRYCNSFHPRTTYWQRLKEIIQIILFRRRLQWIAIEIPWSRFSEEERRKRREKNRRERNSRKINRKQRKK